TATLTHYASDSSGPNFAAGQNSSATVTNATVIVNKAIVATSESFTTGSNLAIGEIATYQVTMIIPEGLMSSAHFLDMLSSGDLEITAIDSLTATSGVTTSVSGGFNALLDQARTAGIGNTSLSFDLGTVT